ncbi:hypothetical protein [Bifidobacterium psychraerophilum]|jgi:hypothetical protein|uniref:hypothetical protein n=2 Tax=Bifidobacterium psychraerophilum TaxID=218140 RepID=UPI0023F28995|nr:hypothetical protein [Bifidobacterium psychraerophilum]MCI1660197.1 hypothetical protein [Bifidobacterium psychraerophilum]MCI1804161.1 hypothetical protein [Bifidobacterium psychraerophilum]MCI2176479.1 hypothetical protein [Bifidobacterium psychraerophilum]
MDVILSIRYWDIRVPFYLTGQGMPVYISMVVVFGQTSGTLALACVAPRLPLTERLATGKVRILSTITATMLGVSAAAVPFIWYGLFASIPTDRIPNHQTYITGGLRFTDVVPISTALLYSVLITMYMAVAVTAISLTGKIIGTCISFLTMIAITIMSAAWPENMILRGDFVRTSTGSMTAICVSVGMLILALVVWCLTNAGSPVTHTKQ